jgi:hypothetical protein
MAETAAFSLLIPETPHDPKIPNEPYPEREPLSGLVDADETIIPFRTKNDPVVVPAGRSGVGKMLVAGAVEVDGGKPPRARLKVIEGFGKALP